MANFTTVVNISWLKSVNEHITAGITQSSAGKRQAAAVVKIIFNGNLFCTSE